MDQEFRDDGTVICPIHGLRYDPELNGGCIRCPRPSQQPGKKSTTPPRSKAPSAAPRQGSVHAPPPSTRAPPASVRGSAGSSPPGRLYPSEPPSRGSFAPAAVGRAGEAPIPYEPGLNLSPGLNDPNLKIIEAPKRKTSRRGLIFGITGVALGGAGAAAWYFRAEGPTNWAKKVAPLSWTGDAGPRSGSIFVPSTPQEAPRPLLFVVDHHGKSVDVVARYARHAERHGWVVAGTDYMGRFGPTANDDVEALSLIEHVRATQNVDATKVMTAGFDHAAESAYRLPALHPDVYAGAIVECGGIATWRDVGGLAKPGTPFYLFTRGGDKSREVTLTMKDEMERKGMRVTFEELPGGHDPMTGEDLENPFLWMEAARG